MALNKEYLKIGADIIKAAFTVKTNVGRGLRESYYEAALAYEIQKLGYTVETQVTVPALYCGMEIRDAYKADIIVDKRVIIEVKALNQLGDSECRQLYTYLRLSNIRLGYLINFGVYDFSIGSTRDKHPLTQGIYRIVNNL